MTILGRYVASLRDCGLRSGDGVAVALSGGPDSLALASMTVWWQGFVRSKDPPLALIVDHRLRPDSTEEAHAVAAQAAELGMQTRMLTLDWAPDALTSGSKMAAARGARYAALFRACAEAQRSHLLLGHQADDQAETFLLRLLHASGVAGLGCMPPVSQQQTEHGRVRVVRPLLGFHKAELEAYCQQQGLRYVVDPTNSNLSYHRNRIRYILTALQAPPAPMEAAGVQPGAEAASSPGSSSSSGSQRWHDESASEGSFEVAASRPGAAADSSNADVHSASSKAGGTSIVEDILLLQRRCAEAAARQQALATRLLQHAVLHTSCDGLPSRQQQQQQQGQPPREGSPQGPGSCGWRGRQRRRQDAAAAWRAWAEQRPWFVDWKARLAEVAHALDPMPYALLDAKCFTKDRAEELAAVPALSRMLQAVSGEQYPPALECSRRLYELLLPGHCYTTLTGGGCLVRRLPRCKGRYVLCIPHNQQDRAEELLKQLSTKTKEHPSDPADAAADGAAAMAAAAAQGQAG